MFPNHKYNKYYFKQNVNIKKYQKNHIISSGCVSIMVHGYKHMEKKEQRG